MIRLHNQHPCDKIKGRVREQHAVVKGFECFVMAVVVNELGEEEHQEKSCGEKESGSRRDVSVEGYTSPDPSAKQQQRDRIAKNAYQFPLSVDRKREQI